MKHTPHSKCVILLLSYERYDLLVRSLAANIKNAGCNVDVIALDQGSKDPRVIEYLRTVCDQVYQAESNIGISEGLNFLLNKAMEIVHYRYFQFAANDTMEQWDWIGQKVVAYAYKARMSGSTNHGMLSTYPGEGDIPAPPCQVIGQFMLTREIVEKVGYFKNFGVKYAPIDNDYNVRCERMGYVNSYLLGYRSRHMDLHDDIYGYDKAAQIQQVWPVHEADFAAYNAENSYIPYTDGGYNIKAIDRLM